MSLVAWVHRQVRKTIPIGENHEKSELCRIRDLPSRRNEFRPEQRKLQLRHNRGQLCWLHPETRTAPSRADFNASRVVRSTLTAPAHVHPQAANAWVMLLPESRRTVATATCSW